MCVCLGKGEGFLPPGRPPVGPVGPWPGPCRPLAGPRRVARFRPVPCAARAHWQPDRSRPQPPVGRRAAGALRPGALLSPTCMSACTAKYDTRSLPASRADARPAGQALAHIAGSQNSSDNTVLGGMIFSFSPAHFFIFAGASTMRRTSARSAGGREGRGGGEKSGSRASPGGPSRGRDPAQVGPAPNVHLKRPRPPLRPPPLLPPPPPPPPPPLEARSRTRPDGPSAARASPVRPGTGTVRPGPGPPFEAGPCRIGPARTRYRTPQPERRPGPAWLGP